MWGEPGSWEPDPSWWVLRRQAFREALDVRWARRAIGPSRWSSFPREAVHAILAAQLSASRSAIAEHARYVENFPDFPIDGLASSRPQNHYNAAQEFKHCLHFNRRA